MNLRRNVFLTSVGLLFGLLTFLFCGICRDPEFYEPSIFVKHRPTLQWHFYSTTGEQDFKELDEKDKKAELAYQEFVEDQKVYTDNLNRLWFVPSILIQLTLTFFSFGIVSQKRVSIKRLLLHFLINLIPMSILVGLMLFNEKPLQLIALTTVLLTINVWTVRITQRKSRAQQTP